MPSPLYPDRFDRTGGWKILPSANSPGVWLTPPDCELRTRPPTVTISKLSSGDSTSANLCHTRETFRSQLAPPSNEREEKLSYSFNQTR